MPFFLWRLRRRRFLRLCVAIFLRLRFLPLGIDHLPHFPRTEARGRLCGMDKGAKGSRREIAGARPSKQPSLPG